MGAVKVGSLESPYSAQWGAFYSGHGVFQWSILYVPLESDVNILGVVLNPACLFALIPALMPRSPPQAGCRSTGISPPAFFFSLRCVFCTDGRPGGVELGTQTLPHPNDWPMATQQPLPPLSLVNWVLWFHCPSELLCRERNPCIPCFNPYFIIIATKVKFLFSLDK